MILAWASPFKGLLGAYAMHMNRNYSPLIADLYVIWIKLRAMWIITLKKCEVTECLYHKVNLIIYFGDKVSLF